MSGSSRRRGFGPHPEFGRRYERTDLTAHRMKSARHRRRTLLIERVYAILKAYYARELEVDASEVEDFAQAVTHRLRPEIQPDWTLDRAERRAFEIAEELFVELGAGEDADENETSEADDGPHPGEDPGADPRPPSNNGSGP